MISFDFSVFAMRPEVEVLRCRIADGQSDIAQSKLQLLTTRWGKPCEQSSCELRERLNNGGCDGGVPHCRQSWAERGVTRSSVSAGTNCVCRVTPDAVGGFSPNDCRTGAALGGLQSQKSPSQARFRINSDSQISKAVMKAEFNAFRNTFVCGSFFRPSHMVALANVVSPHFVKELLRRNSETCLSGQAIEAVDVGRSGSVRKAQAKKNKSAATSKSNRCGNCVLFFG